MSQWTDSPCMGKVLYSFTATGQFQISLSEGEMVEIQKTSQGWYKGKVVGREAKGIFPVTYVEIIPADGAAETSTTETPSSVPSATSSLPLSQSSSIMAPPARAAPSTPGTVTPTKGSPAASPTASSSSSAAQRKWPNGAPSNAAPPPLPSNANRGSEITGPISSLTINRDSVKAPPALSSFGQRGSVKPVPPPMMSMQGGGLAINTNTDTNNSSPIPSPLPSPSKMGPPPIPAQLQKANSALPVTTSFPPPMNRPTSSPSPATIPKPGAAPTASSPMQKKESMIVSMSASPKPTANLLPTSSSIVGQNSSYPSGDNVDGEGGAKLKDNISIEALMMEIDYTQTDWTKSIDECLRDGNVVEYGRQMERMSSLFELRRRIINAEEMKLSEKERNDVRHEIIELIESSRKMQEGFMVPRNAKGEIADTLNTPIIELSKLHKVMYSTLKEETSLLWMQKVQERQGKSLKSSLAAKIQQQAGTSSSSALSSNDRSLAALAALLPAPKFPAGQLQLFLDVKMCIFSVGEACDLFFSLYSLGESKFVSDDFCLSITEAGMPTNLKLLGKMQTIFAELEEKDFNADLWLVCKIYRKGRLILDPKEKKPPPRVHRRPWGCAAMSLTYSGLHEVGLKTEFQPQNAAMTIYTCREESQFPKIHEFIIKGSTSAIEEAPKAKGIAMGLTLFSGDLEPLRNSNDPKDKEKFGECPITRKLFFPDFMTAADTRNDFYIYLLGGIFQQDGKKSARNVEVVVRVMREDGQTIEKCIARGSGDSMETEYRSSVYYHLNSPIFDDRICLHIPLETLERCHLLFTFWHISKTSRNSAPFAFGFLPLTDSTGAVIQDDDYKISTFKPFNNIEKPTSASYLRSQKDLSSRKDEFRVKTLLLSTVKTQNSILHSLFNWKSMEINILKNNLKSFTLINKSSLAQLAKFVRETFDVFFAILVAPTAQYGGAHDDVFKSILHMLSLFTDKKLPQYRPLIDGYMTSLFSQPTIHTHLINLTASALDAAGKGKCDSHTQKLAKSISYLLKFIITSRQLDSAATNASSTDSQFKANLMKLLRAINVFIQVKEPEGNSSVPTSPKAGDAKEAAAPALVGSEGTTLLSSQSYLIRNFPDATKDLLLIFSFSELATIARDLIYAIPAKQTSQVDKLNLVRHLIQQPDLMREADFKNILYPVAIGILVAHFKSVEATQSLGEPYLCVAILMTMLQAQQVSFLTLADPASSSSETISKSNELFGDFLPLLDSLVHVVHLLQLNQSGEIQLKPPNESIMASCKIDFYNDALTCLFTILHITPESNFDKHMMTLLKEVNTLSGAAPVTKWGSRSPSSPSTSSSLMRFLQELLLIFRSVLSHPLYPDMWVVMNMLVFSIIQRILSRVNPILKSNFYMGPSFVPSLFSSFFDIAFAFLSDPQLRLESFSTRKFQFITSRYGDVRTKIKEEIKDLWNFMQNQKLTIMEKVTPLFFQLAFHSPDDAAAATTGRRQTELKTDSKPSLKQQGSWQGSASLATIPSSPSFLNQPTAAPLAPSSTPNELQRLGLELYFDILKTEFVVSRTSSSSQISQFNAASVSYVDSASAASHPILLSPQDPFSNIERYTIDALYHLSNLNNDSSNVAMSRFVYFLNSKISSEGSANGFQQSGMEFLKHVQRMYELMRGLSRFPDTALFEDERTTVALALIHYLESTGQGVRRKEMFSRYVQYLVDLHLSLKNFVEAGFTQLQLIKILQWNSTATLPPMNNNMDYPQQPEKERKEKMYQNAVKYFTEGENYEQAIECLEELREYYQYESFDYAKLASLLVEQSDLFKSIIRGERFYPNYFRVCYFGEFESEVKDKEFVYRGEKLEPIMDFCGRIKKKYPDAKLFMSSEKPTNEQLRETKQIISITTLSKCTEMEKKEVAHVITKLPPSAAQLLPAPSSRFSVSANAPPSKDVEAPKYVPPAVLKYRENSSLRVFSYSRAIQKGTDKKPANEFKDLWVSKTFIFCDDSFPTNKRRCEVVERLEILLSPIENAVTTIINKNSELAEKIDQVVNWPSDQPVDVGPLSMNLNGMIDAAVNGGTQKYIEAFLTDPSPGMTSDPQFKTKQQQLKTAIKEQIQHLKSGLDVFGKKCDQKLKGLYEHLSNFYEEMTRKITHVLQ